MESTALTLERWCVQHLLLRDGVHNIYPREMEYKAFTYKRWSSHHLLMKDVGTTASTDERWSPQHLHMRDAIVALLLFPAVRCEAGNDTGHYLFPLLLHH